MVASSQNSGNYYGGSYAYNVQLTVPMTMSCGNAGPQVWARGTVFDTVSNTNLGTNYATMNSNNGYYSGQLVFNLPSSVVEHQLQVQIQVYNSYNNGQYSGLVATSSPTVTIHASPYNAPSSNSYYNGYSNSYYNGYPTGYYNGYYYYTYYPSYSYYYNGYSYYYYPYSYYYSSYPSYYHYSSCYNGQTIIYYNGNYYYASCYSYYHHH